MLPAIRIENVSKLYRVGEIGTGSLAHDVNRWWHHVRGKEDPYSCVAESNDRTTTGNSDYVWALKNVSFEIEQGQAIGIIGRNGAGKSTLLKILSRVTSPTTGQIKARGRIASLLEVGTGFHPELTGRENIYLNGAILGMRKLEISRRLDEIIEFSGCERYIDTPVKRYSSGMYVRLAFAVAAHLDPETLIVDEVLAVGDAEFQRKCLGKMGDVAGRGKTVIFVSHNLGAVRNLCTQVIVMENGTLGFKGSMAEGISHYEDSFYRAEKILSEVEFHGSLKNEITFTSIVAKQTSCNVQIIDPLVPFEIELSGTAKRDFPSLEIKICLFSEGYFLGSCHDTAAASPMASGAFVSRFSFPSNFFRAGRYTIGVGAAAQGAWVWGSDVKSIEVSENFGGQHPERCEGIFAIPYQATRMQSPADSCSQTDLGVKSV
jgi:lipopolysaccharide transport system ATP-binding protein